MSSNPYENEPGFEAANDEADKKNQKDYVMKVCRLVYVHLYAHFIQIRHESLRISIIQRLEAYLGIAANGAVEEPANLDEESEDERDADTEYDELPVVFDPFKDFTKRRFLWYYDSYLLAISKAKLEVKVDQPFVRMPFEGSGNGMDGRLS